MPKIKKPLSFKEWIAERKYYRNLAHAPGCDYASGLSPDEQPLAGIVYPNGYYIEHWTDNRNGVEPEQGIPIWVLTLGNSQPTSYNLEALEEQLFEHASNEDGHVVEVDLPAPDWHELVRDAVSQAVEAELPMFEAVPDLAVSDLGPQDWMGTRAFALKLGERIVATVAVRPTSFD